MCNTKIFLLGDSFTDNLFKFYSESILDFKAFPNKNWSNIKSNEIVKYLMKLQSISAPKPLWFDDWLREWGYDVYNFAKQGCTIEHIIYQFSKIKDFDYNKGDRIILNWTHPSRFNWITDALNCHFIHSNVDECHPSSPAELFKEQAVNRELSFFTNENNYAYLNKNLLPFMEYIVELHSKYKPIIWTPFLDVEKSIQKQKWNFPFKHYLVHTEFTSKLSKLPNFEIREETLNEYKDGHYGQYGNYYIAVLFDEIIKSNIGPYYNNDSKVIFDKALDRIKSEKKEFITKFKLI
jgi:hypothetical protein